MNCPEPTIRVNMLNGSPLVSVDGSMSAWHAKAVEDVVQGLLREGTGALTLDISRASFSDGHCLESLISMLGAVRSQMRVVAVASGRAAATLKRADLEPLVTVCPNMDEAAEIVRPDPEQLAPKWLARSSGDDELPLAA
jgi:anti-anti-sigma regulatory factor